MQGGFGGNPESLASGQNFQFSKMQNDIWDAVLKTYFTSNQKFMASVAKELDDDPDSKNEFFRTLFEKMHLELKNIKQETFFQAERNLEILKSLFEFEGAIPVFVNSNLFLSPTMNGM